MTPNLAIVIPAYKPDFLRETLQSIAAQTDQRFSLYIFDDASPADLEKIVKEFVFASKVVYKRFHINLGQESLVNHWRRCISETGEEEWIWLFSDDDLMAPDCVESFYNALEKNADCVAYRFHTKKISTGGDIIRQNQFPDRFNGADFLNIKLAYKQESYIVEYIFLRDIYQKIGGFPDLPLAWTTDDLFCLKLADYGSICTIGGGTVSWRYSDLNISGKNSRSNAVLKMEAAGEFIKRILNNKTLLQKLTPDDLPVSWYVRQIRTMLGQLTLMDELKAVKRISSGDKRVWQYYFRMKKNRSKIAGWLKRFSS